MKTQINLFRNLRPGLALAITTALMVAQAACSQPAAGLADERLKSTVKYASAQASVQDIVQSLAEQAGLSYDRQKSFAQTDPLCRRWVRNVAIEGMTCHEALDQILKPVGLRYQVENGTIVLSRLPGVPAASPGPNPPSAPAAGGGLNEPPKFQAAREALRGPQKDTLRAQQLLLEVVGKDRATLPPALLGYAYVYLGYIEDLAGRRQKAIEWYQQALAAKDSDEGIRACAEFGLKQPLTWIRHLDEGASPPGSSSTSQPPAKGYVTTGPAPGGLMPSLTLSAKAQRENFEFLCQAIDETYADFELKAINWDKVRRHYRARLDPNASADRFYRLLFQLVNELRDTHSWLENYRLPSPAGQPGLTVDLFEGKPFVVAVNADSDAAKAGVKPGAEVLAVDGLSFEAKLKEMRSWLRACSSDRAFRREACGHLLAGEPGSQVALKLRSPDGHTETLTLERTLRSGNPPPPTFPCEMTHQQFVHFGRLPSGLGYIRMTSFLSHEQVAPEFDRALEALRDAPGLILDIRDNPGGFGQPQVVGRLLQERTLCAITFQKNGPGHRDLQRQEAFLEPAGPWQYSGPVALLVNDVTGSAADLFTCFLRSAKRVVTVGTTTHGNLSGVAAYAVLPCGLVVRISNGYICDASGKPVEGDGNEPDLSVTPTIADFLNGKDPVLEKAMTVLKEKLAKSQSRI
jgi:carboxyl-terminal processing protease